MMMSFEDDRRDEKVAGKSVLRVVEIAARLYWSRYRLIRKMNCVHTLDEEVSLQSQSEQEHGRAPLILSDCADTRLWPRKLSRPYFRSAMSFFP
jgi:hypothetical protein